MRAKVRAGSTQTWSRHPGWACTPSSAYSASRRHWMRMSASRDSTCRSRKPIGVGQRDRWRQFRRRGSCSTWERGGKPSAGHLSTSPRSAAVLRIEFGAGLIAVGGRGDRPLVDKLMRTLGRDSCPGSLRTNAAHRARGAGRRVGPGRLQRHRPASSGGGGRGAGGRDLHVHKPQADRSVRATCRDRSELRLVRTELHQEMPSDGMHGRADTQPRLADRSGPAQAAHGPGPGGLSAINRVSLTNGAPVYRGINTPAGESEFNASGLIDPRAPDQCSSSESEWTGQTDRRHDLRSSRS